MKTETLEPKQAEAQDKAYAYALTYAQLIRQGLQKGIAEHELLTLRTAYDLAEQLFDGYYRGQGMPFICHLVRTASIVLHEDFPLEAAAAALLHAAYAMGQFEDGICGMPTPAHRNQIRQILGEKTEALVMGYYEMPWGNAEKIQNHRANFYFWTDEKKQLLAMRLANELEDHLDLAMAYRGGIDGKKRIGELGEAMTELARKMGLRLAPALQQAYQEHREADLPACLVRTHKNSYEHPERAWQKKSTKARIQVYWNKKTASFLKALGLKRGSR